MENVTKERVYNLQTAIMEANRCLLCDDAPCNTDCGADTQPAKFIRQLKMGNIKGAIRTIRQNNVLGGVCAHICPTCRLCVKGCSRSGLDEPIHISEIQAFLMDYERKEGLKVFNAPAPGDKRVAIIGSGPAGLSAAANLAIKGYSVTVFDRSPQPGGILRHGIPPHRLPDEVLAHELGILRDLGIQFKCGVSINGKDALEKLLRKDYDAVFLAVGLDAPKKLPIPGSDARGVYLWNEFLARAKDSPQRKKFATLVKGKNIVVIGGGSVALDCAVTARLAGAERVYCVSLEAIEELPADRDEVSLALSVGVRLRPNCRILEIKKEKGRVRALRGEEIRWIVPDRFVPENAEAIAGSEFSMPADIVVESIGTGISVELQTLVSHLKKSGMYVRVKPETMQTSHPRIYAGGDITGAGKTVAECVKDGKKAAEAIAKAIPLSTPAIIARRACPSLAVNFCGLNFPNPFCLSSSPVGNTAQMLSRAFDAGWGGAIFKTLNLERDYPIIDPTPRLNALHYDEKRLIGLQNIEMVSERPFEQNLKDIAYLKKHYPRKRLIVSIMGYSDEGWAELARGAEKAGADMLELNFSCPQMAVEGAGHKVGQSYDLIRHYTRVVKDCVSIPVMAKMTPNITDMLPVAIAAKDGGADAISAINTLRAITEVDLDTFVPKPSIQGKGSISGYSGPAVKPIALRFIAEMAQCKNLGLPLSGIGGIETWSDAVMFLLMGATTVQSTTAVMRYGYRIIEDLTEGLEDYLVTRGFDSAQLLIGLGLQNLVDPSEHHQKMHVISGVDEEKCIGCGLCHIVCHDGANQAMTFDTEKRKAKVDEERCVGCLLCKHVCPVWDCISTTEIDHPVTGGMHEDALRFIQ